MFRWKLRILRKSMKFVSLLKRFIQMESISMQSILLEEQDALIGKELTVRKVPVKILDKDAEFAAIENDTLSNQQKIIVSCEKAIEEGMTVKEKET